jgi:D-ribose pyranase
MLKSVLLNSEIAKEIAALGHTQNIVIADAGLPIGKDQRCIDLAVKRGLPSFIEVLKTVSSDLIIESYIYANEAVEQNATIYTQMMQIMDGKGCRGVPHEEFKKLSQEAAVVIRTGECTPYANVILIGGVDF